MTDGISIRDARLDDHSTFAKLFLELGVDDPIKSPERFDTEMVPTTLIAERDGTIAGYAFYRAMKDTVHLFHLVSAPHARRMGVGRRLMTEVARRAKEAGCSFMMLNVLPTNAHAIALYESFGLEQQYMSRALKMEWATLEALPDAAAPWVNDAREIDPADDERLERETKLMAGILADQRARPGRVLRMLERDPGRIALAIFDPGFPGVRPLRAPDGAHALSLLRSFRPYARAEDALVHMMVEDQAPIAEALIASGAKLKLEVLSMQGPLR